MLTARQVKLRQASTHTAKPCLASMTLQKYLMSSIVTLFSCGNAYFERDLFAGVYGIQRSLRMIIADHLQLPTAFRCRMYIRISAHDTPLCDPVADPHPRRLHADVAVRRADPLQ
jgi:hypothetical protein